MKQFSCKTKIVSGPGTISHLKELGVRRLLLVTDPFFMENGTAEKLAKLSGAEKWEIFHQIRPDPTVELVAEGTAAVKQFQPDTLVALGGGSAMECAKAMAYFSGMDIRLVAIPTTSGSGSEVTDFAVVTNGQVKYPLVDTRLCPDVAILDGDLLGGMPPKLVADTGFDVLCHAVEAYVALNASPITDALARDAFTACYGALPASYGGKTHVRQRIHVAATMAGMAFHQAGLGLCHAMAHSLGGMFHVPHGRLNGILLPSVITLNAHVASGKYATLARAAGLLGSAETVAVRNLINALTRLRRELDLPATLAQAGVDPRRVWSNTKQIVETVLADPCCKTNPLKVEDFMVRKILEEVTGRV